MLCAFLIRHREVRRSNGVVEYILAKDFRNRSLAAILSARSLTTAISDVGHEKERQRDQQ